jgi:hypothetical protein
MTSNDELYRIGTAMLDAFADKQVEVIECSYNGTPQGLVNACEEIASAWCMRVENNMPMVYNLKAGRFESQPPVESPIQAVSVTQETAILALIAPKTKARGEIRANRVAGDRSILTVTYKKSTPEVGESWVWLRTKLETQGLIAVQPTPSAAPDALTSPTSDAGNGQSTTALDVRQLHKKLDECFNEEDLRDLCFGLVEYENLGGSTKSGKARELITWFEKRSRLNELVELLRQKRPNVSW